MMTASVDRSVTTELSQAIEHVIGLGHQHAAVIAGPKDHRTALMIRYALEAGTKRAEARPFSGHAVRLAR
jgi:DNA-binding LacI/PurR family transcriptional regulator